jgi:alpha-tubulin suppressor-like RCC1 family protein
LYAFGRNQNGQLGLGHTHDQLSPQLVQSLAVSVALGVALEKQSMYAHAAIAQADTTVGCFCHDWSIAWYTALQGQQIASVAGGAEHTIAATTTGRVSCMWQCIQQAMPL